MVELNLSRQSRLVPEDKLSEYNIEIFGVGSVGSHVADTLAKTGFKNIGVYDMDFVEEENISAQAFRFKDIDKKKVDAVKDIIKEGCGLDIKTFHGKIEEKTNIKIEPNTIYCCFFDSIEARQLLFNKVKDFPVLFVDARIGEYNKRFYLVDCSDEEEKKEYWESLTTGKSIELECGIKACAPINKQLAGQISMELIKYISNKPYVKKHIGNVITPNYDIYVIQERKSITEKKKDELKKDEIELDFSKLNDDPKESDIEPKIEEKLGDS